MLLSNMELIATAPGGVAKLRELILTLAVQGKLVPQDPADEPASVLLQKIRAEKDRLVAEGKSKRDKPLAEIAEEEKPFELPQGWEWARLGQIATQVTDGTHHTPKYLPTGVAFISVKDIDGNTVSFNDCKFISEEEHRQINARCNPEKGDLLLCRIGTLGRPTLVDTDRPFSLFVSVGLIKLPKSSNLSTYIHLVMKSPLLVDQYQEIKAGGSHTNKLNLGDIPQLRIPVPPLAEQSRIVTRVEALMRLCDALEAKGQLEATQHAQLVSTLLGTLTASTTPEELADNWQRVAQHFDLLLDRPEAIDALEQTLLQLAVRGLLVPQDPTDESASALLQRIRAEKDRLIATGQIKRDKPLPPITDEEKPFELPQGWAWVKGRDLFTVVRGVTYQKADAKDAPAEGLLPILRANNIRGSINFDDLVYVPASLISEDQLLRSGDYVVCLASGSKNLVGKAAPFRPEVTCSFGAFCGAIRPITDAAYFAVYLASPMYRESVSEASAGIGINNLKGSSLLDLDIALPPLPEQSRIVTRVTALRRLCTDLRQRLAECQSVQARLAEALVQEVA